MQLESFILYSPRLFSFLLLYFFDEMLEELIERIEQHKKQL